MYFMLSSSQSLIRTFWSFNLNHPFEKWLWFWFSHSYLKEGASHCKRVFDSWIWIIENYFWGNSWISFASGVLRWWLENLLLPSIWVFVVRSIYFSRNIVLSTRGRLQLGRFCRGSSTRLAWLRLYQGVFISIVAIYDFILLFLCSISCFLMRHQIWYGWHLLCRREDALASLGETICI